MDELEIKNAVIESTHLGKDDNDCFSFNFGLNYGGTGQGTGYICLDHYNKKKEVRVGWEFGIDFIKGILDVVGVRTWEELKGKHIRVKSNNYKVAAIGNFLKDEWFDFDEFFKEHMNG